MLSILSTIEFLRALPPDQNGLGAVELLNVGKQDLLALAEPVDDLDLGDAGRAGLDIAQGGQAALEDVDLAAAAALEERAARHLEHVRLAVEEQPHRDPL